MGNLFLRSALRQGRPLGRPGLAIAFVASLAAWALACGSDGRAGGGGAGAAGDGGGAAGGGGGAAGGGGKGGGAAGEGGPGAENPCDAAYERRVDVATGAELESALSGASPGTLIRLADGAYEGRFEAKTPGTAGRPIALCGGKGAVVGGRPYGVHVTADNWILAGFVVAGSAKGVVLDGASGCQLVGLTVHDVDEEGVHFRSNSSKNTLRGSTIYATGRKTPGFGEGVYLGSAKSNWGEYSNGEPDKSDGNSVLYNTIGPDVTAEAVDVKEGTTGGLIQGNTFVGKGMSGENFADSWVDVKGNGYDITDNGGTDALQDGFQVHAVVDGWGVGNKFYRNEAAVNGPGYGFWVDKKATGNVVGCDNAAAGAVSGLANVDCAP